MEVHLARVASRTPLGCSLDLQTHQQPWLASAQHREGGPACIIDGPQRVKTQSLTMILLSVDNLKAGEIVNKP